MLVILEDLDRRGLLRRTDAGHVLGPKTIARMEARDASPGAGAMTVAAIVLAGGASSRFGGDKLAAPLGDRPVLAHVVEVASRVATRVVRRHRARRRRARRSRASTRAGPGRAPGPARRPRSRACEPSPRRT